MILSKEATEEGMQSLKSLNRKVKYHIKIQLNSISMFTCMSVKERHDSMTSKLQK